MEYINELYQFFLGSNGVSTDTRTIQAGQFFIALSGPNFNGNQYAYQALEKGAVMVVVDDPDYYNQDDMHYLVSDCLETLQALAKHHRRNLDCKILAITGSNGKTTTKELTTAALSKKYNCFSTEGNLNNHIGVPLTLLSLTQNVEIAVVEMGANHQGEIKMLCDIAEPDFGFITNIGKAHLEGFGGLEGVLTGKTEMYNYLRDNRGKAFMNTDDEILMSKSAGLDMIQFRSSLYNVESSKEAHISLTLESRIYHSKLIGDYNKRNLVAAIEIAKYFDVDNEDIVSAIAKYDPDNNRSQKIDKDGHIFILDAYNANPSSMELSIKNFSESPFEKKVLILGEMLELGAYSEAEHLNLVNYISNINDLHGVWLVGKAFEIIDTPPDFKIFKQVEDLINWFQSSGKKDHYSFLIKGSRANALEKFYHSFKSTL